MKDGDIRDQVFGILHRIAPEADLDHIRPDENLREALDIDSFDFLNIMIALHEKFGIDIPESSYREVSSLKGILDYLART
jgi:acyl carrier protein